MKNLFLSTFFIVLASLFMLANAQTEKQIVIKKKTIDSNGVETVEEIILTGDEAENIDINDYINDNSSIEDIDIDINIEELDNIDEEDFQIFRFDGQSIEDMLQNNPDISDEIKEKLKDIDLGDIKGLDGLGQQKIIIMSDGEQLLNEDLNEMFDSSDFKWNSDGQSFSFQSCEDKGDPKAFLGVWPGEITNDKGVVLGGIVEESAAEKAGLLEGDIVTTIGGKMVKTFSELSTVIKEHQPKDNVMIQYIRNGKSRSVNVTLGENKSKTQSQISYFNIDEENEMDIQDRFLKGYNFSSCCNHNKEVEKAYIGIMIENSDKGVKIVDVNREDEILENHDIVVKFGKTDISDINQLIKTVAQYNPGDKVKIQYERDGKIKKSKVKLLGKMVKECCKDSDCCKDKKTSQTTEIIIKQNNKEIKSDLGNSLLELQDVNLYPNPSNGKFNLEFTTSDLSPLNIVITNSNGKEIIKDEIVDFNGSYAGDFNLKGNAPGLYLINIYQNGKVLTKKIVIK